MEPGWELAMINTAVPRRGFLGMCALLGAGVATGQSRAETSAELDPETVRRWYRIWETTKDWHQADAMLADDFTFTSAAGDDHISKAAFKKNCWDTQVHLISRFDLLDVFTDRDAAFVMYNGVTNKEKIFRNVEFLRFKDGRITSIECYFGAPSSYPSAVNKLQEK